MEKIEPKKISSLYVIILEMAKNFHAYLLAVEKISWCATGTRKPVRVIYFRRVENAKKKRKWSTIKFFADSEMYEITRQKGKNFGTNGKAWKKIDNFLARNVGPYIWEVSFSEGKRAPTFHTEIRSGNIRKIREQRSKRRRVGGKSEGEKKFF